MCSTYIRLEFRYAFQWNVMRSCPLSPFTFSQSHSSFYLLGTMIAITFPSLSLSLVWIHSSCGINRYTSRNRSVQ